MSYFDVEIKEIECYNKPPKRCSFGMCTDNNNTVYIFGGYYGVGKPKLLNDLWKINMNNINKKPEWIELQKRRYNGDNWPSVNEGMTMEYYNGKLYVIGARKGKLNHAHFFWEYSIAKHCWNKIMVTSYSMNQKRFSHKTLIYKHYIVLYGGIVPRMFCKEGLYLFDLNEYKWHTINIENYMHRFNHGMTILNDKLYMYGGRDKDRYIINSMFYIDIKDVVSNINNTNTAVAVEIENMDNTNIYGHSLIAWKNHLICVCGKSKQESTKQCDTFNNNIISIDVNNNNTSNFKFIQTNYDNYTRFKQNHCLLNINNTDYICIFGGWGTDDSLDDMMLIKVIDKNNIKTQKTLKKDTELSNDIDEIKVHSDDEIIDIQKQQKLKKLCSNIDKKTKKRDKQLNRIKKLKAKYENISEQKDRLTLKSDIKSLKCNEMILNEMTINDLSKLYNIVLNNALQIKNELIIRLQNQLLCQICNINVINGVINPCGHTGCFNCIKKLDKCHICNTELSGFFKSN